MDRETDHAAVVVVGGGFAGLACADRLGRAGVDTLVIDRRNHSLFQPLLYQVATAALSPADIAEPIRKSLGRWSSVRVMLAEVTGIAGNAVCLSHGNRVGFDRLVIATGSDYSYFGHSDWRYHAPGLKTLREARRIRQRLLTAFEDAEACDDADRRRALLTTVVVGGGPTGVEMAGAVAELGRGMVRRDFRRLRPGDLRVVLVEAETRLLAAFPADLAAYAEARLRRMGVEPMLGTQVEGMGPGRVTLTGAEGRGGGVLEAGCIVWAAGVKPSPAARWLGLGDTARGAVPVGPDLRVQGRANIFALGDTARLPDPLPGLAQVARQQGRWLGEKLVADLRGNSPTGVFRFRNRGNTAVIGRNAAVFDFGRWQLRGRLAWFLWAAVHVALLINAEKRMLVGVQWAVRYVTRQRGARVIDEPDPATARPPEGEGR